MKTQNLALGLGVVAVGFVAGILGGGLFGGTETVKEVVRDLGANPGPTYTEKQEFLGGVLYGNNVASSSQGATITFTAAEFKNWANSDFVSYAPGLLIQTLTFPASSTLRDLLPNAGDTQKFCVRNATSTAGTGTNFAAGTGIDLEVGSSTVATVGSLRLTTGATACLTLIRQVSTASTFDITVLYDAFVDAD